MVNACLEISTYQGISLGAVHWYGHVVFNDTEYKRIELTRKLSAKEAKEWNKSDEHRTYEAGESTYRFNTEEDVLKAGIQYFKSNYKGVLFRGDSACLSAWKRVIFWPDIKEFNDIVKKMNAISDNFIALNGYEGPDRKKVEKLDKKWYALYRTLLLHCKNPL